MFALSLDLGGTHIGCTVVRDREVLAFASFDSEKAASLASLLPSITDTLRQLLAEAGASAMEVRQGCMAVWAANAMALTHAYDPEVVVMGGGEMRRADIILPFVQDHVGKHAWVAWGKLQIRAAWLGDKAALLGAVPLLCEVF